MQTITKYGLYDKISRKLIQFWVNPVSDSDIEYNLDLSGDSVWLVDSRQDAEDALTANTDFETFYNIPNHSFYGEVNLQVVEVTLTFNPEGE